MGLRLHFTQNIDGCLEAAIGRGGLSDGALKERLERLSPRVQSLKDAYRDESLALLRISEARDDVAAASAALERLSEGADTIVFFGTGGSSLGGQTLAQLGGWYIPGGKRENMTRRPRVRFYDNLDGVTLKGAMKLFDLETTRFVVTSKSGGTAETLTQALVALKAIEEAGLKDKVSKLFLGVTEPAKEGKRNALRDLFGGLGVEMLDHHTGIGGRFSCLTNVGLLPALAFGLDAYAIRAGAQDSLNLLLNNDDPAVIPSAIGAAVSAGLDDERGVGVSVMMPYADRLARFAAWYVQLWSESLGKNGAGTAPLAALGPVDQHSILQLLMDGPHDFLINLVRTKAAGTGPVIDAELARSVGLDYLAGRAVGDLTAAQQEATAQALIEAGRPVRTFDIETLDEKSLGALLMHFMLETILAAHLYGVDPFDQPAVEIGKKIAVKALSS